MRPIFRIDIQNMNVEELIILLDTLTLARDLYDEGTLTDLLTASIDEIICLIEIDDPAEAGILAARYL